MKTREINNKHYIDAKVVMLPTDKAENALIKSDCDRLSYHKGYLTQDYIKNSLNGKSYHLYITSNEQIKEGDWYIDMFDSKEDWFVYKAGEETLAKGWFEGCKKIIASTDFIIIKNDNIFSSAIKSLPQPSNEFIQSFIESYNKEEVITDVLVEYEVNVLMDDGDDLSNMFKLKLKDNNIIIKKKEEDWDDIIMSSGVSSSDYYFTRLVKHLKENYNPPTKK